MSLTPELRRMVWLDKFKRELSPCYDSNANPMELLQLYTISIQAMRGGHRVMANWLHMALKDIVREWFLNLPEVSISSLEDMCN